MRTIQETNKLFEKFKTKFNFYDSYINGTSWSRGGNVRNCWGDDNEITPDPPPYFNYDSCYEFKYHIINSIFKEISEEDKNKIFRLVVDFEHYSDGDYYGGTEYYSRFIYDVRKLFNVIDEMFGIERVMGDEN